MHVVKTRLLYKPHIFVTTVHVCAACVYILCDWGLMEAAAPGPSLSNE